MFKKFHERKGTNNNKNADNTTYQHIKKQKESTKLKYTEKYTNRKQQYQEFRKPTLQLITTQHFIYHGHMNNDCKHGEGIMMIKNGNMIFGTWNQDLLDGRAFILTSLGGKIMANFNIGKLNGWALLSYGQSILKCLYFYENNFEGEKITYENLQNLWISSKCNSQGKLISITHVQKGSLQQMPEFIKSEELKELINSFVINKENFISFMNIHQFHINFATNYIGYVDEETKPCGLGAIYTDKQIYCGNYFQGALEHFGRMVFENGEIYHGQMIGGAFWKEGIYYSPTKNITSIIFTDEYSQTIKKQVQGYIMINFKPIIGRQHFNDKIGIKGNSVNSLIQSLQPYYQYQFVTKFQKKNDYRDFDNNSQYGKSQEYKEENQARDYQKKIQISNLNKKNVKQADKHKQAEKWIKFSGQQQQIQTRFRRSQSVDKRQASAKRKNGNFDVKIKGLSQYESIPIKQNIYKQQQQNYNKHHPPNTKVMQEIHFNFANSGNHLQSKSLQIDNINLKSSTQPTPANKIIARVDKTSKISQIQNSEKSSISQNSNQINSLLQKNKGYRRNIFY